MDSARSPEDLAFRKYSGFFHLSLKEWQALQDGLLTEQFELVGCSMWAEPFRRYGPLRSIGELRATAPLTTYEQYAPYLREAKQALATAHQWAYTSGPGGTDKWVPYTQPALEQVAGSVMAAFILGAAKGEGEVAVHPGDKVIYNVAPPPYLTGLIARLLQERFHLRSVPPLEEAESMEFRPRLDSSFRLALRSGVDMVCSLSSVLIHMGEYLEQRRQAPRIERHPVGLARQARAKLTSWLDSRSVLPKDLWHVKCVVGWGLDTSAYRKQIAYYWGREPYEFYACTEAGILGLQSWNKKGLTPVPHTAFLEFLPEADALGPSTPATATKTVLLSEVVTGQRYEVVLSSFYGMPFLRYRTGHLVRVLAQSDPQTGVQLPQLELVGRSDGIIDLSGFARLDEKTLWEAIAQTCSDYVEWAACKEFDNGHAVLRVYLERPVRVPLAELEDRLHESLTQLDPSYADIERMLGFRPLRVVVLSPGAFERWAAVKGVEKAALSDQRFPRISPTSGLIDPLLRLSAELAGRR